MDLSNCKIFPIDFHVKIHNFFCTPQNENNPSYEITVNYMKENNKKKWIIQRTYSEISILHKILMAKFQSTPYLPSKIAHYLSNKENQERARLVEVYINICLKNYVMLNSLELRLFLDIEQELQIYLQPLIIKQDLELDNFFPLQIKYWKFKRICFVLTSQDNFDQKGAIKNVLTSFKKMFQKQTIKGVIYVLKEKNLNQQNFEPFLHQDFDQSPTCIDTIESLQFLCVGFQNGQIQIFYLNSKFELQKKQVINAHQYQINRIQIIEDKGLILSFGNDKSFNYMEIQSEKNYSQEFNFFKQRITAFCYVKRKSMIFLGDENGYLYVYTIQKDYSIPFKLALNQYLRESSIQGITLSKNDKYLFVAFYDGQIEVYDLGNDFSSKPTFIQNHLFNKEIFEFCTNNKKNTLITIENNGMISFCEVLNYQNIYSQKLHHQKIKSFVLIENENLLMTTGLDKRVKFFNYNEYLNTNKFDPKRGIQFYEEKIIEQYSLPSDQVNTQKINNINNMQNFTVQNKPQIKTQQQDKSESSESEEDMRDWN